MRPPLRVLLVVVVAMAGSPHMVTILSGCTALACHGAEDCAA